MAHAPLLRTNTAPVFQSTMDGVAARFNSTMSMSGTPRASQLSGSTAVGSTTSLNTLTPATTASPPPGNGGPVMATGNIINQKADASRSLYQICVTLKQRLALVPGWENYLAQLEHMAADLDDGGPVESLWKLLRTGYPLLAIYNALQPEKPLQVEEKAGDHSEAKRAKIAILKFVQACLNELKLPPAECFIINDLTGNDTTGFVKVSTVYPLCFFPSFLSFCCDF